MRVRLKRDKLLDLLAHSGISQNHWALKLGLSRGHWSDIVNGRHPYPSAKTREVLLEVLGVGFDDLFEVDHGPGLSDPALHAAIAVRYVFDREIGQGGMGTVYLARDVKLNRVVAIKVVAEEAVGGVGVKRFLSEVGHVARLQHPHIVPLFDAGDAAGTPFYVMPYFRDGSLRDLLAQRQRLGLDEALTLVRGIGSALQRAHVHQILHCDVKPGNVLLDGGHAYVADFGIARALHREALEWGRRTDVDPSAGTPAYVSPEQATGHADLDGRSDLYSLGCLVFEMLAGRPPFEGRTTIETIAGRFNAPTPDLRRFAPELPPDVAGVVRGAMAIERDDRPESVGAFLAELDRAARRRAPAIVVTTRLGVSRAAGRLRRRLAGLPLSARAGRWVESLVRDTRHAGRGLARSPGFALTAMLSLALGIGANTTIFSLINAVMLKTLPVHRPEELVRITLGNSAAGGTTLTNPLWEQLREHQPQFGGLSAFSVGGFDLATGGPRDRVLATYVSGDYFRMLGVSTVLGRPITPADDVRGCPGVAVLSEAFWRSRFGGSRDVIGRTMPIDGRPFEVIGVAQPGFSGLVVGIASGFFVPICSDAIVRGSSLRLDHPATWWLSVFGRPREGGTTDQLAAGLALLAPRMMAATVSPEWTVERQEAYVRQTLAAEPAATGLSGLRAAYSRSLYLMMGVVGLVLFIACANVAHLLLARATARERELAIRIGLGAGRARVVRQLLTESLLLSAGGAALGTAFAVWGGRFLVRLLSSSTSEIALDLGIDVTMLAFTAVVAIGTALAFGVLPAWRATRVDPQAVLKAGGRGVAEGHSRFGLGKALVTAQVGMSLVLVVTALLLSQTLRGLATQEAGFQEEHVLLVRVDLSYTAYPESQYGTVHAEVLARLRALPGVRAASTAWFTPLSGGSRNDYYRIEGYTPTSSDDVLVYDNVIGDGYFATLRTRLLAGRDFDTRDRVGSPPVALVNAAFARKFFGGGSPLGKRFNTSDTLAPPIEIVGVVEDTRYQSLRSEPYPMAFFPVSQDPSPPGNTLFAVWTAASESVAAPGVIAAVQDVDPGILIGVGTLSQQVADSLRRERVLATLSGFFGVLALLLAAVGLYGTLSYGVSRRGHEIGVRMALGATGGTVSRMVLGEMGTLVAVGLAAGVAAALGTTRLVSSFLYGLTPTDPRSFALAIVVLLGVAALAGYLPARRAATQDPMVTLRAD